MGIHIRKNLALLYSPGSRKRAFFVFIHLLCGKYHKVLSFTCSMYAECLKALAFGCSPNCKLQKVLALSYSLCGECPKVLPFTCSSFGKWHNVLALCHSPPGKCQNVLAFTHSPRGESWKAPFFEHILFKNYQLTLFTNL